MLLVALAQALAADPALLTCPGTQPCDGVCISWAELCPTVALAAAPAAIDGFCGAGPAPKTVEPPLHTDARVVTDPPKPPKEPCDGAEVPTPASERATTSPAKAP